MANTSETTEQMLNPGTGEILDQKELAERLDAQTTGIGVGLAGNGDLLNRLTRTRWKLRRRLTVRAPQPRAWPDVVGAQHAH